MKSGRLTRRQFLRGVGGTAVALPFLPSLFGATEAVAADPPYPKRFIALFMSNGMREANWYPTQEPAGGWTTLGPDVRECALTQFPGNLSVVLGPEFDPLREKLMVLRGLDVMQYLAGNHYEPIMLSGWGHQQAKRVTVDQILARSSRIYEMEPRFRSLHLMVKKGYQDGSSSISWSNVGGTVTRVPHDYNPWAVFDSLFNQGVSSGEERDRIYARRLGVVDRVLAGFLRLSRSPRLSREDRERLDAHMTFIRDLERRLEGERAGGSCQAPGRPEVNNLAETLIPTNMTSQIDNLVVAIRCGLTRVATLMLCPETDLNGGSHLPDPPGEHHSVSHGAKDDPESSVKKGRLEAFYGRCVAELLAKLDTVEDPVTGRTYLDNSLVYFGNSSGAIRPGAEVHDSTDMPVLLAGATGRIRGGKFVDYRNLAATRDNECCNGYRHTWGYKLGRPYNGLLVTLMQAMGLTPAEYEQHGGEGLGDYTNNDYGQYDTSDRRSPLPFVLK